MEDSPGDGRVAVAPASGRIRAPTIAAKSMRRSAALLVALVTVGSLLTAEQAPAMRDRSLVLEAGEAPIQARGFAAVTRGVAPGRLVPMRLETTGAGPFKALGLAGARLVFDYQPVPHAELESLEVIRAPSWHSLGLTGSGVKVAVVDIGFGGYQGLLGSSLPAAVNTKTFLSNGSMGADPHGTAVAEIVTAIAGGAQLSLVAVGAESDFEPLVDWLIAEDIDVVNTSLGWTAGPFDGRSSPVPGAVARAVEAGIGWVASAGNSALTHWGGPFVPS